MLNNSENFSVLEMSPSKIKETQGGLAFLGAGAIAGLAIATYLTSSVVAFTQMGNS